MTQESLLDDPLLEQRILDRAEAVRQTEAGIAKAAHKLEDERGAAWRAEALAAVRRVAERQEALTGDDVWQELGAVSEFYSAQIGIVFRQAKKLCYIETTAQFVESQRPARHRSGIRVWRSLVYGGG